MEHSQWFIVGLNLLTSSLKCAVVIKVTFKNISVILWQSVLMEYPEKITDLSHKSLTNWRTQRKLLTYPTSH